MTPITKNILGYINGRNVPISISTPQGSPIFLEPGQPILSPSGELTGKSDTLEGYVSQKLLSRVYDNDPKWVNFQRRKSASPQKKESPSPSDAKIPLPPKMTVSSVSGPSLETGRTTTVKELAEEVTANNDGTFTYKGKKFTSKAAIDVYKKGIEPQQ